MKLRKRLTAMLMAATLTATSVMPSNLMAVFAEESIIEETVDEAAAEESAEEWMIDEPADVWNAAASTQADLMAEDLIVDDDAEESGGEALVDGLELLNLADIAEEADLLSVAEEETESVEESAEPIETAEEADLELIEAAEEADLEPIEAVEEADLEPAAEETNLGLIEAEEDGLESVEAEEAESELTEEEETESSLIEKEETESAAEDADFELTSEKADAEEEETEASEEATEAVTEASEEAAKENESTEKETEAAESVLPENAEDETEAVFEVLEEETESVTEEAETEEAETEEEETEEAAAAMLMLADAAPTQADITILLTTDGSNQANSAVQYRSSSYTSYTLVRRVKGTENWETVYKNSNLTSIGLVGGKYQASRTFSNQPLYNSYGEAYEYAVKRHNYISGNAYSSSPSYPVMSDQFTVGGDEAALVDENYTVTDTWYLPETKDITLTVKWDDKDNKFGLRPTEHGSASISPDGGTTWIEAEAAVDEEGTVTYTWEDVPVNYNSSGNFIAYRFRQNDLSGYYTAGTATRTGGDNYTVTNSLQADRRTARVLFNMQNYILYETNALKYGLPFAEEIKAYLYRDDELIDEVVFTPASNTSGRYWQLQDQELIAPKYDQEGNTLTGELRVEFESIYDDDLRFDTSVTQLNSTTVRYNVNTYAANYTVQTIAYDDGGLTELRPAAASLVQHVYLDGEEIDTRTSSSSYTLTTVPTKDIDGNDIETTFTIDNIPAYYELETTVTDNNLNPSNIYYRGYKVQHTLKLKDPQTFTATVKFEGDLGSTEELKVRPTSLNLQLEYSSDGGETWQSYPGITNAVISEPSGRGTEWTYTWEQLPGVDPDGNPVIYRVHQEDKLTVYATSEDDPVYTVDEDGKLTETTQTIHNAYLDNWNYAIDLHWNKTGLEKYAQITESYAYASQAKAEYVLTVNVQKPYKAGDLEIRLPLALFQKRDGSYVVPSGYGLGDEDNPSPDFKFTYRIDDKGTEDAGDDEIVFYNYKDLAASENLVTRVSYSFYLRDIEDLSIGSITATATGSYDLGTVKSEPETQVSQTITYEVDTGAQITKSTNSDYPVKGFYSRIYRSGISYAKNTVEGSYDFENYNYVIYRIYHYYQGNQPSVLTYTDTPGNEGRVVGIYYSNGTDPTFSWDEETGTATWQSSKAASNSTTEIYYVTVRYPRTAVEDEETGELTYETTYTNDVDISCDVTDDHEGHDSEEDDFDHSTLQGHAEAEWVDYRFIYNGEIISASKSMGDYTNPGITLAESGVSPGTPSIYFTQYVYGYNFSDGYYMEMDDDAIYITATINGQAIRTRLTEEDYELAGTPVLIVSTSDIDRSNGATITGAVYEEPFVVWGRKGNSGDWEVISEITMTQSAYKSYSTGVSLDGKGYTALRVTSPQGLVGQTRMTLENIRLKTNFESQLFQELFANGENLTQITFDNFSAHRYYLPDEEGNYEWANTRNAAHSRAQTYGLDAVDRAETGCNQLRKNDNTTINRISFTSSRSKLTESVTANPTTQTVTANFAIGAMEYTTGLGLPYEVYQTNLNTDSAVFYDLLPEGYYFDDSQAVTVQAGNAQGGRALVSSDIGNSSSLTYTNRAYKYVNGYNSFYNNLLMPVSGALVNVETINNYKNTGRQMVIFHVQSLAEAGDNLCFVYQSSNWAVASGFTVRYSATAAYKDLVSGQSRINYMAYQRGDGRDIWGGQTERGSVNLNGTYPYEDVNEDGVAGQKDTLHASATVIPSFLSSLQTGLNKQVKGVSPYYVLDDIVELDQNYSYKLVFSTSSGGVTKNVVIYDILENAENTEGHSGEPGRWEGDSFLGVNVSDLEALGIDVKIWYSVNAKNTLSYNDWEADGYVPEDHTDVWTDTAPADLSTVTAIAFDLRTGTDGEAFVFDPETIVSMEIFMNAPDTVQEYEYAYNRPAYHSMFIPDGSAEEKDHFNISNRTTLRLRDWQDIEFTKITYNDDGEAIPLAAVGFELYQCANEEADHVHDEPGTTGSCWGTAIRTAVSGADGNVLFKRLDSGVYAVKETTTRSDMESMSGRWWEFTVDAYKGTVSTPVAKSSSANTPQDMLWDADGSNVRLENIRLKKSINVTKSWSETSAHKSQRPTTLELQLYRNNGSEPIKTVTVEAPEGGFKDSGVIYTFEDLEAYDIYGGTYVYKVVEVVPDGYYVNSPSGVTAANGSGTKSVSLTNSEPGSLKITKQVSGVKTDQAFEIKLTFTSAVYKLTEISGTLTDADGGEQDITVELTNNVGTFSLKDGQTVLFTDLPYTYYRVEEVDSGNYNVSYTNAYSYINTGTSAATIRSAVVKNTAAPAEVTLPAVNKTVTGPVPEGEDQTFTFTLSSSTTGAPLPSPASITVDGSGSASFGTIKFTSEGTYTYTLKEVDGKVPAYTYDDTVYTITVVVTNDNGQLVAAWSAPNGQPKSFDFANDYDPTSVAVKKVWDDNNDQDGKRLQNVTVVLVKNGKDTDQTKQLNAGTNWSAEFTGLAKKENGEEIVYTVREQTVPAGYTETVTGDAENGFVITNTHTPEVITVAGSKTWDDADDQDGKRPTSITIRLLKAGQVYQTKTVTAASGWKWSFADLPKYENGSEIRWSIDELQIEEYSTTYNGYNVTNSYTPDQTSITVGKSWVDNNDQDGIRPASVTVELLKNNKPTGITKILNAGTNWTATFTELDEREAGQLITYSVQEVNVPAGYSSVVGGSMSSGYIITNTHTPETIDVEGSKTWDDSNNQDGKRPTSITVHLLKAGQTIATKTVTAANEWSWSFKNLPKYENGTEIRYSISEEAVEEYTPAYGGLNDYNVTNSYTPGKVSISVEKSWLDNNNQDGIRPNGVTVVLVKNGRDTDVTKQLNAGTNWAAVFSDLDEYENGNKIVYTVRELEVPEGYQSAVRGDVNSGFTVINTHNPEKTSISGRKIWDDANNQDGERPDSITIHLLKAGQSIQTVTVTANDDWKWSFTDLDKYENGSEIRYSIREETVEGYTPDYGTTGTYNVTNTRTPSTVSVAVEKSWQDSNNQDGIRPNSVTVVLVKNGTETNQTKLLNAGTGWAAVFTDLDEFTNGGQKINWTVRELNVPDGYQSTVRGDMSTGYTITNTHTPETTSVSGAKTWDDNDNQDGKRPQSITIRLLASGQVLQTRTVTSANGWTWSFTNLPKYSAGTLIRYSIDELEIEDYSTTYDGFNVTNSYTPGKTSVTVSKSWQDNNNQDGIRPDSVTVELFKDGVGTGETKQLNIGTNWAATFTDLDEYESGQKITWTVRETTVPEGYQSTVRGSMAEGYIITNTHNPEKVDISGSKTWDDNNNQDNKRPESITVYLQKAGQTVDSRTVTAADNWSWTFTGLAKYENGQEIRYGVSEEAIEGYTPTYGGAGSYSIKNSYTPSKTAVSVKKSWQDNNNQDGIRPNSVTVVLVKNGIETSQTKELNAGTNWEAVFSDLDEYEGGSKIVYTVREIQIPSGYESTIRSDGNGSYVITNTHTPETVEISGLKTWNDSNNQDGKRPESITVYLLKAGQKTETKTVTASDGWRYSFTGLPKYENGVEIRYGISEEAVEGYTPTYGGAGDYNITNTYTPGKVSVSVEKSWQDNNNQDGIRPNNVTVVLVKNGVETNQTKQLSAGTNWEAVFSDLDEYENGQKITYTVKEQTTPTGYQSAVRGSMTSGFVITNTHTPETVDIKGAKTWDDSNNQDGKRPGSITIHLTKAGQVIRTQTVTASDGWSWSFTGLAKYENGAEIRYGIREEIAEDYTPEYGGTGSYNVTNHYTPGKVSVSVEKSWIDNNNQDGIRPQNVTVVLVKNGVETNQTKQLNAGTDWKAVFSDLDEYEHTQKIVYTVKEAETVTGYTSAVRGDMTSGFVITNTHTPETISISGSKTWDDNNNQDGDRPDSITIHLLKAGQIERTVTVTALDNWSWRFTDLPKYDSGSEIRYTITEEAVPEYSTTYRGYDVINTHTPDQTSLTVEKSWQDNNNQDGIRPNGITVRLLKDGIETDQTKELNAGTNWTATFSNLAEYDNGRKIAYTVKEENVPAGYTSTIRGDMTKGYTITNTHTPETVDVKGTKTWDDEDNQDGKRPGSITVHLLKAGQSISSVTVTAADGWSWSFTNLPKYENGGSMIRYGVSEEIAEGYTPSYGSTGSYNITNSYTPGKVAVEVDKSWLDGSNQDGIRPDSIEVVLVKDGEDTDITMKLNAAGNWEGVFSDLDEYEDGEKISYSVRELNVPEGYQSTVRGDMTKGYTITNTHTPETTSIAGSKTWNDNDDQDDARPESITIQLMKGGQLYQTKTVTEEDGWAWSFENLPKYENGGSLIRYSISELQIPEYSTTYDGYNVTNTHTPNKTSVTVEKSWIDHNNQDGKRPDSVTVELLKNGEPTDVTLTLDAAGNWTGTFTDLDENEAGEKITYTVREVDVPDGYSSAVRGDASTGFTVTNTHTPETVEIAGSKTWEDENNRDGQRPESITIRLLQDGLPIASREVTAEDGWSWSFTGLPKYRNQGTEIVYSITEDTVSHYSASISEDGYDVTNRYTPKRISVSVSKQWQDNDDQDGLRDAVTVELLKNGESTGITKILNEAGRWTAEFDELYEYENGQKITYSVQETEKPAGYTESITGNMTEGFIVTNTHEPETVVIEGSKTWDDADNQDGVRPDSIEITLLADSEALETVTVTEDENGNWSWRFENLPKYKDHGTEIVYTIEETEIDEYVASINGFDITNTHEPEKTELSVTKIWEDAEDQDGLRPDQVSVELLKNGETTGITRQLDAEHNWRAVFNDLDVYEAGERIDYTVEESEVPEGYEGIITGDAENGYVVTNTHEPELVDIEGSKTWDDADDQDGIRPDSIEITLLADSEALETVTVTEDENGNWSWRFDNLPKYKDHGTEIVYTIEEEQVTDYETVVDGFDITNTHEPEKISIKVTKVWKDAEDQDGLRPAEISVELLKNGEATGRIKHLEADQDWSVVFENLDVYEAGKEIEYSVEESGVPKGYISEITGDKENGFVITNTHEPETVEIEGSKTWDDADDQDGIRPDSIVVTLLADGVEEETQNVAADENGNWSWHFGDLPKYRAQGTEIIYTIKEAAVNGYTSVVDEFDITNTHEPEKTSVAVEKIWADAEDQDGLRTGQIVAELVKNGESTGIIRKLDEQNGWKAVFENLDKYEAGEQITYTVEEVNVPAGYISTVTGNMENGYVITNTHEPELVDIEGSKTWDDADDQDGMRPADIEINLLADGEKLETRKVTADDSWSWQFKDLPKYRDNGIEIIYTIEEAAVEGYTAAVKGYDVTNTHIPGTIEVSGSKTWVDDDNRDGIRPESIQIRLLADGKSIQTKVVTAADNWSWRFMDLPKNTDQGKQITYTIEEETVKGYETQISGYNVTNTHEAESISVKGIKVWKDDSNSAGKRPDSIVIKLQANGKTIKSQTVTAGDNWIWSFEDLPKYENAGTEIVYTVVEQTVSGYTAKITGDSSSGFVVTNTLENEAKTSSGNSSSSHSSSSKSSGSSSASSKSSTKSSSSSSSTKSSSGTPKTGDTSRPMLWMTLLLASLAMLLGLIFYRRRRRSG